MSSNGYSDDEESPIPQDFVNEAFAQQTQTASPRTELLSPTSPRALQGELDRLRSGQRGPSERYRRQREQAYANVSSRQLLSLLIEKEYESSKLRKALHRAFDRFESEATRASEAERVTQETLNQFRAVNESKVEAERALAKTNEELRLWKFQFDHAQREIARAQEVVQLVERQRDDAERVAAHARTTARALNEHRLVSDALEEGKRLGYKAGFRRAQREMAYTQDTNPEDAFQDMEREIENGDNYSAGQQEDNDRAWRLDGSPLQPIRDINASPIPAPRSPQILRMPELPSSSRQPPEAGPPPAMPSPRPAMAMPSPIAAPPSRAFETESVRRAPPSVRSPSIQLSRYSVEIPSASVFNQPLASNHREEHHRPPPSQAQYQDPPQSARDVPPRRPSPSQYQPPPVSRLPDNYIPSTSAEGGIALPPPFQLSQPIQPAAPPVEAPRTQSWYNRDGPEESAQNQSSWYQPKRPRSNAGSVTGRSNAGSAAGRSARHTRHASLDSRVSTNLPKSQKLGANYGADLGAIKEDARSTKGTYAYAVPERGWDNNPNAQRARSMRGSTESLVPPPPPPKDPKQMIADGLRYSDPDLPEAWRRSAAVNAETGSSKSRPPRNVRVPAHLTFPAPLSPPDAPVALGHMRARSMSGSTGKSGWSQPPNIVELVGRPSLRRVKEKRPISPSDVGSPYFGTIRVEPPTQSFSQMGAAPQADQYLSPNYQTQTLPQTTQNTLPSGFQPQSVTVPAQVTMPVTFKGKSISGPVSFPTAGGGGEQERPPSGLSNYRASGFGGSNTSINRPRSTSMHAPARAEAPPPVRPLSVLSNSNMSRKSGKSGRTDYVAGPTLTTGPTLTHQASNTSLRSTGSGYARFDAESYVDPAYFASTGGALPVPAPRSRHGSGSSHHSGLSYMGPP